MIKCGRLYLDVSAPTLVNDRRLYLVIPHYHGTGLVNVGVCSGYTRDCLISSWIYAQKANWPPNGNVQWGVKH